MPLYKYGENSAVTSVRVTKGESGASRAYLKAGDSVNADTLQATMQALSKAGYIIAPCNSDGENLLEVRGFKKFEDLHKTLSDSNSVKGMPEKHKLKDDAFSFRKWFKRRGLMLSALFYMVGDFCYIRYEKVNTGIKETKKQEKREAINKAVADGGGKEADMMPEISPHKASVWDWLAGYGYLAGTSSSLASMLLRGDITGIEMGEISRRTLSVLKDVGIETGDLPISNTAKIVDARNPLLRAFLSRSADLLNGFFALAGFAIGKDNAETLHRLHEEEKKYGKFYDFKNNPRHIHDKFVAGLDVALGTGTVTSGAISVAVEEQPIDVNKPKAEGLSGAVESLKERPLKIAAGGYLLSTVIHLLSSGIERWSIIRDNKSRTEDKKFPVTHTAWRLGFVLSNLVAEIVMFYSSKGHGASIKSDDSMDATTMAMVAQAIHKQPPEKRAELIEKVHKSIAGVKVLNIKYDEAKKLLEQQVAALDKNPWHQVFAKAPATKTATAIGDLNKSPISQLNSETQIPQKIDGAWADALFQNAKPQQDNGVGNLFDLAAKKPALQKVT